VVDFGKVEVSRDGASVELTAHEFKTLQFFVQNPDRVITRAELVKHACGYGDGSTGSRSIDNHIMELRHKLEKNPGCPTHFRTVLRLGYKFTFKVFERMQLLEGALEYFGTVLNTFKTVPVFPFGFTATRVERTLVSSSICSWEISYPA